ncbi:unnamed protein product [Closterium sp. NIES-65]|nr:unnamed protein product [Closterium sp. NIES-65]
MAKDQAVGARSTSVNGCATHANPPPIAQTAKSGSSAAMESSEAVEARSSLSTKSVHAGERPGRPLVVDSLTTPIVQTSTYFFKDTADLIEFVEGRKTSFEYGRYGNPTTDTVERKISELEQAEATLLSSSGMCAATTMLLALVPAGGHIVTTTDCYRRTRQFIQTMLPKMGITTTVIDPADMGALEKALDENEVTLNDLRTSLLSVNPASSCCRPPALLSLIPLHSPAPLPLSLSLLLSPFPSLFTPLPFPALLSSPPLSLSPPLPPPPVRQVSLFFSESPTNPYLRCIDVPLVSGLCHAKGALVCIDGTFATPINQHVLPLGADLVLHSGTKYLAGHNDVLAGTISGKAELVQKVRALHNVLGGVVDPHASYLILRGLKTLALRVRRQNETAMELALALSNHPKVLRVHYPGLPSHPEHQIALEQMHGGYGGVVSFEVDGNLERTSRFIDALDIPYIAPSLGGVESLVEQPTIISYWDYGPEERARLGIKDNLVRFSAGIEDSCDIIADVMQALDKI